MSEVWIGKAILAIVVIGRGVADGAPCFYCRDEAELQQKSLLLAKVLNAGVHEVGKGCCIIVKH